MSGRAPGLIRRIQRLARLLAGRNPLRRPYDRIEGAILLGLSAIFLAAMTGASVFGAHIYQSQRAGAAQLRPAAAILTQDGPPDTNVAPTGRALARWPAPDGRERSGVLTALIAPGISGAAAGTRVPVWLNRLGQPATPPPGQALMIVDALLTAAVATAAAAAVLLIAYQLCRLALDRRRLAAWESAWALTGPRWTSRH
jgi:hypothetical protein